MSDIKKGYTFTDKSTDWVSNKETAIRLNKMVDDAKLNLVAGANITITPTANGPSIAATGAGTGTVTSVNLTAGTSISVSGGPITTSGSITVNNTAPDQVVSLTGAGTTTVTGTYPSFTISSADSTTGTVTSVAATAGTGISVSGSPITTSGTLTITNSAPDQTVSLTGAGTTSITGTYPSFTVTSNDAFTGTVTSVAATAGTGITISGSPITSSGTLSITNSAPDQTVALTASTGITTSGTYPNFTIANSAPDQTVAIGAGTGISVSGTYPNFTVTNSSPSSGGTVTSVSGAGGSTGLTLTGGPITGSGTLTLGGTLVVANGGTGTASPSLVAGSNVTISGSWPNQTINSVAGGTGTVTNVSVTTANGVSGTVTNSTTTPAISLSLGAITPTSVAASGTVSGSNLSGTNTGDQTNISGNAATVTTNANLTGPITSVGNATSVAAQTGTGSTFVMQASPTLTTPALGTPTSGLLNSCTSNINATGNVPRTFQARAADVFNVKDFGATGDGSTNDLPAFNAASNAMLSAGGGCIVIPAGSYNLSGAWTITKTNKSQSVCIRGYGCGVTKLHFNTASNGIEIIGTVNQTEGATNSNVDTVEDLSICASQAGTYKALKIVGKNSNSSSIGCLVRRISFEGFTKPSPTTSQYWDTSIHLVDCGNAAIQEVRSVSAARVGDGILLESSAAQTICNIYGVNLQGHDFGVRVIGNNAYEGVTLYACTLVAMNTGVFWDTISGEEQLNITDCHINPAVSYIVVNNCERVWVTNLNGLIDQRGGAAPTIAAGSFVVGRRYKIKTVGTTDFTDIGASANTVGVSFVARQPTLAATSLVNGTAYRILTIGSTDFTLIGATSNNVGLYFVATGAGTGTGTAYSLAATPAVGSGTGDAYQTASIDIRGSCRQSKVVHCCIDGSAEEYAIICQSPLTSFVDNVMKGHSTGIFLDSGSDLGLATGNQLYNSAGTARAGTCVQDNGAGNQVFNNY